VRIEASCNDFPNERLPRHDADQSLRVGDEHGAYFRPL
jgi:hypothetical protein